jgi:hypothetical protein
LTQAGDGAVAGTVSYDSTTNTATLTPSTPLLFSTSYTATVASTIKAADGTPLAGPVTWSFTTQAGTTTRINTGGGAYTSSSGASFVADTNFTGGSTYTTSAAISGTSDPALFQNER